MADDGIALLRLGYKEFGFHFGGFPLLSFPHFLSLSTHTEKTSCLVVRSPVGRPKWHGKELKPCLKPANNHERGWKRILNSIQVLRWLLAPPSGLAWPQTHKLPWARTAQRGGSYIPDKQKLWNNVCCFKLLSFEAICDAATDKYNDYLRTYGCFTQYCFSSGNSLLSWKSVSIRLFPSSVLVLPGMTSLRSSRAEDSVTEPAGTEYSERLEH